MYRYRHVCVVCVCVFFLVECGVFLLFFFFFYPSFLILFLSLSEFQVDVKCIYVCIFSLPIYLYTSMYSFIYLLISLQLFTVQREVSIAVYSPYIHLSVHTPRCFSSSFLSFVSLLRTTAYCPPQYNPVNACECLLSFFLFVSILGRR